MIIITSMFQARSPRKIKSDDIVDHAHGSPSEAGGFLKVAKDNGNGSRCSTPTEVNTTFSVRAVAESNKVEIVYNPGLCCLKHCLSLKVDHRSLCLE